MEAPLTLFVWSRSRIVPVRITDFSITEEAFDPALNPIRAKVSLGMRVLSVDDLGFDHKGGSLFMATCSRKSSWPTKSHGRRASALSASEAFHDRSSSSLQALLQAGSSDTLFPPNSRYHGIETATLPAGDGRTIVYLRRRFVPPPERFALLQEHRRRRATGSTTSPRNISATPSSSGACATPTARCGPTS